MYTDDNTLAVGIRQGHIRHEGAIRSVGMLFYVGAILMSLLNLAKVVMGKEEMLTGGFFIVLSALYFMVGHSFRNLNPKAKVPGTILSAIGLLVFPIGTLINAYVLYLIHSEKGKTVLSDNYQTVIEATPEIKHKTSILVWIVAAIMVFFILMFLVAFIMRAFAK